jgi:hypothetical protein
MFDINIQFDEVQISSVENGDLAYMQKWFNSESLGCIKTENPLKFNDFYKRFIEYYASECEFFLKVHLKQKLIGIIKGRVEFKNNNQVWITDFLMDSENTNEKVSSNILNKVMFYFSSSYGINSFFAGVMEENIMLMEFWQCNCFEIQRIAKNFYNINGIKKDMLIFKWNGNK